MATKLSVRSRIGIAVDMQGCPNRCRHCYLGKRSAGRLGQADLRWVVEQFRCFRRPVGAASPWTELRVSSWLYEPDYAPDYRRLYMLENELSGLPSLRPQYELLSAWRAARDEEYARWLYDIGVRAGQLTFFGMEEATDWGWRRKGAFSDLMITTERLLAAGIRPRWQLIFTTRILPDLKELISLAEELRLKERCEALGGEFRFFMHCPAPCGEGWYLEELRPTLDDLQQVPEWLRDSHELHSEAELLSEISDDPRPVKSSLADLEGPHLFLLVAPNYDVYSNAGSELTQPWRLGNLRRDGVMPILDTLECCRTPGLKALFTVPVAELAKRFGRPGNRQIYHPEDLKDRWTRLWAMEHI